MLSYNNDHEFKARVLEQVEAHRKADALVRGTYGVMTDGMFRGCAVGCALRSLDRLDGRGARESYQGHRELAERLGIPLVLAYLEDRIFEGLPQPEAMLWPTLFARAIPVGADLSLVWPRFAHWLLADPATGVIRHARNEQEADAIAGVADLLAKQIAGVIVPAKEWATARSAAYDAAAAAAAYAADAASAYAYACAASAAYAASARSRHYKLMADKLLQLMGEAKKEE